MGLFHHRGMGATNGTSRLIVALDIRIVTAIAVFSSASIVNAQAPPITHPKEIDSTDRELWVGNVTRYLSDSVWRNSGRYDATHLLMVPLHAAFALREPEWQEQFVDHFKRFLLSNPPDTFSVRDELSWLQYDYLASQFIVLAARSRVSNPAGLADLLGNQLREIWSVRPAWQWAGPPFRGGMQERLQWKLHSLDVKKSYYRAITDHEQYVFAIAADLITYERVTDTRHSWSTTMRDILDVARLTYSQRVVWQPDGGWLLQPGVWADHPEYLYAGQLEKVEGMNPAPLKDVAEDASHSFRRPLWLQSLFQASRNAAEAGYYAKLIAGLERQFFAHVLVPPTPDFPAFRTTNWMDGRNGVFRWHYLPRVPGWGYGPYELSGSFTFGWWTFLDTERIRTAYAEEAKQYPLPLKVLRVYEPNTSTEVLTSPSRRNLDGFRELIVRLASKL